MRKAIFPVVTCRICGSKRFEYLCTTFNEHSKTTQIANYRCMECGSVFVGNEIDAEELSVAYSDLNTTEYYKEIYSENKKKMAISIGHLESLAPKNVKIIDIGCGDGLFVEMLYDAGFRNVSAHEIEGADLSRIKDRASHIYQDFDYTSIPADSFDVVTLLDVVEHVLDPNYLKKICKRILKPGGIIYFHTPIVTKTDRMMHFIQKFPLIRKAGVIWQRGRTSIFHLENYTPKSLALILKNADFQKIEIEVCNELSWPVSRYIRIYLLEKQGLPEFFAPFLVPIFYPFLATELLNSNKAFVTARLRV